MFSNVTALFRKYHRQLAILTLLPMILVTLTGILIPLSEELGMGNITQFIVKLHSGSFFGSDLVYSVLVGLGLLGLIVTGISMTGLVPSKKRPLSEDFES